MYKFILILGLLFLSGCRKPVCIAWEKAYGGVQCEESRSLYTPMLNFGKTRWEESNFCTKLVTCKRCLKFSQDAYLENMSIPADTCK